MKKQLPFRARKAIIEFLVQQEQPESLEDAIEIAKEWNEKSDQALIEANNYNLTQIERREHAHA